MTMANTQGAMPPTALKTLTDILNPVSAITSAGTGLFNTYTGYKNMKLNERDIKLKEQAQGYALKTAEEEKARKRDIRNMMLKGRV
jgi:hypothetical protein